MAVLSRLFARVSLAIWLVGAVAIGATLQARHLLALPAASIGQPAREASASLLVGTGERLAVWHVLSADCACSRKIAEHLASRAPLPGSVETLVWVTKGDRPAPAVSGMRLLVLTPQELEQRFGAVAAPQLVVIDATGDVRYVGGYTRSKQGEAEDARIITALATGDAPPPLPLFGCAVSAELQRLADPAGLAAFTETRR